MTPPELPYGNPEYGGWQQPPPNAPEQVVAVLGDITITPSEVITPGGSFPLQGSTWTINDMTHVESKMPTWALVIAIIGFFVVCIFSLFFLMAKEQTVMGGIQISVRSGQAFHTVTIPVHNRSQISQIHQQFNYVRSIAMSM